MGTELKKYGCLDPTPRESGLTGTRYGLSTGVCKNAPAPASAEPRVTAPAPAPAPQKGLP